MKYTFTCLLTISFFFAFSQKPDILVKFCPVALFDDISFPTIQGGVEFRVSHKWTWYNELGIKYRKSRMDDADTIFVRSGAFTGIKFKTEARYYLQAFRKPPYTGLYVATNLFFTKDNHNTQIDYYHGNPYPVMTDAFGVKKTTYGSNLLVGFQKYNSRPRGFGIEFYAGFGIRVRNVQTVGQQYNPHTDYFYPSVDPVFPDYRGEIDATPGTFVVLNFTTGFRVFYKL